MALLNSKKLLIHAQKNNYAVAAINVENMEMAQGVINAAEELSSPVIIQTTPSTLKYADPSIFAALITALANNANVPIVLHLDHGSSFQLAQQAMNVGYSSVMIDGSREDLEQNIKLTKSVVDIARPLNISVEAELGKLGGKEDDLDGGDENNTTDPQDAKVFVEQTNVDSLAIAIGTAHGIYKGTPVLDVNTLIKIRKLIDTPIVLHGASGINLSDITTCINEGICKVNYATEFRIAYTKAVRETLTSNSDIFDPKIYGNAAKDAVKNLAKNLITICSNGKKVAKIEDLI